MWLVDTFNKIFKSVNVPVVNEPVREITYIGFINPSDKVYVVQQSTHSGIINYCISASQGERMKLYNELSTLQGADVYKYLHGRLLIEPILEDDFKTVLKLIKTKLPSVNIEDFSPFML